MRTPIPSFAAAATPQQTRSHFGHVRTIATCLALAVGSAATAQSFQQGDLYLLSPTITGVGTGNGALVRLRPSDGSAAIVRNLAVTPQVSDGLTFDTHRNAMLFMAQLTIGGPYQLWQCDAAGNTVGLGFVGRGFAAFAPTGDGRVYLRDLQEIPAGRIHYLDAGNQLHTLLDGTGTGPFEFFPGQATQYRCMHFHAPTNALFVAQSSGTTQVCGGGAATTRLAIRRVPLSADGTRVVGPVGCAEFEVSATGEVVVGLDQIDDGTLLAIVDTNSNSAEPRMVRIDPWTMATSAFATNGSYVGAAATNAGCYSAALGSAVVHDTFNDGLRGFLAGQAGGGTPMTFTVPVSTGGSSGEITTLVEVRGTPCAGTFVGYGDGLAGTGGFVPTFTATGCPVPGAALDLHVAAALGGGTCVLALGTDPAAVPMFGGTVLLTPLVFVTIPLAGAPLAAGEGRLTAPLVLPTNPAITGLSLYGQAAVLDPGAVQGIALTPGLRIVIG
ncbi:MAG: hypothetical protein JNL12_07940 [Planctomycetes bacterium]|nr:hypothetical protein [Planctomycetota bacterium]